MWAARKSSLETLRIQQARVYGFGQPGAFRNGLIGIVADGGCDCQEKVVRFDANGGKPCEAAYVFAVRFEDDK